MVGRDAACGEDWHPQEPPQPTTTQPASTTPRGVTFPAGLHPACSMLSKETLGNIETEMPRQSL